MRRAESVYFFADCHLTTRRTPEEEARNQRLDRFLVHVRDYASHLYILGDLFDFWFEYRHAIPSGHLWLFRRFYEIREAQIPVVFLSGNHDYWCMDFLSREFGFEVSPRPIEASHQGRRMWLAHGDGLIQRDWAYRILRQVLRNPFAIWAYRTLHPDLGISLALSSSSSSRHVTELRDLAQEAYLEEVVKPRFAEGYDSVIMGHIHIPTHISEGGRDFIFLGDWITKFTYVTLEEGAFRQQAWEG